MQLHCAVAIGSGRLSSFRAPLLQCTWWVVVGLATASRPARHFNLDNPGAYKVPAYATLKRFAMKKYLPRLAVAAAALLSIGAAQATVITFDGLSPSPFATNMPLLGDGDEFYQSGYFFAPFSNDANAQVGDLVGAIVDGADVANTCFSVACPTNNSTHFYTALNDGVLSMGSISGAPFKLQGLSASFVGAAGEVFPGTTLILRAQGVKASGGTLTASINLPGQVGGSFSFANYSYSAAFANTPMTAIYFFGLACNSSGSCSAFSSDKGQFALDNITVVPEPSEWLLMGLGLVAVGAVVRRRSAA